ncbi:tetratricopeptide repeat protein [Streptomyces diastatochromogenes]|nr:tetratricopeptide repeat protein [Streptomyces diastatochromogenes]
MLRGDGARWPHGRPLRARGYALATLAWASRLDGDTGAATAAADRSVDCFRALDDPHGESLALNTLGSIHRRRGDHDAARNHLEAALAIRRRLGDRREEASPSGASACSTWPPGTPTARRRPCPMSSRASRRPTTSRAPPTPCSTSGSWPGPRVTRREPSPC